MAVELLGNLGESTLSAAITSTSATTLTVTSAASFPAAVTGTSQFRVIVDTEIMIVTNVSGTTFTVTRGAEGTTAATHSNTAPITAVITAGTLQAMFGGGSTGQVLAKTSSADYAQVWATNGSAGGDYFRSGYYSHGMFPGQVMTNAALTLSRLFARPFLIPVRRSFDRIGINVVAGATAASGGVVRLGIYADGGGQPGALLLDAGTVSSESTGAREITISQTLDPGVVWLACVAQVSTCTPSVYATTSLTPWGQTGTTPPSSSVGAGGYVSGVTGALPAWSESGTANTCPAVSLRAA